MINKNFIIGITGAFGSGKSTAAKFFESKGFHKITLSYFLEQEARKRGVRKITRKILQDIGNEWREKFGRGILARRALEHFEKNNIKKAVIDGIRNIGEVEVFSKKNKFVLLAIIANRKIRFDRIKKRKGRESLNPELFKKLDIRDLGIGEKPTGLQVAYCIAVADVFISNNRDKERFIEKLKKLEKHI